MGTETKRGQVIQMDPVYYSFLLDAIPDKGRKKCFKKALTRYKRACAKAFKQLLRDIEKCK